MSQKRFKLGELQQQLTMAQMMPKYEFDPEANGRAARIAELNRAKKTLYTRSRRHAQEASAISTAILRSREWPALLDDVLDELEELQLVQERKAFDPDRDDPGAIQPRAGSRPRRA